MTIADKLTQRELLELARFRETLPQDTPKFIKRILMNTTMGKNGDITIMPYDLKQF